MIIKTYTSTNGRLDNYIGVSNRVQNISKYKPHAY